MRKKLGKLAISSLLIVIPFLITVYIGIEDAYSQPPPPGGGGDPPCWPPPCIPIDGGIGFLIAAGIAYGGKKAFDSLKNK